MATPVRELLVLLHLFADSGGDDAAWGDFGEERARNTLMRFSASDWDSLLETSSQLSSGELEVLSLVLASETHRHAVPLLIRALLTVQSNGWMEVAEALASRHLTDSTALVSYEQELQSPQAAQFIESRVRDWLNFPSNEYATFDEYLATYSHLVDPAVISLIALARRSPNTSLERTRGL